MAVFAAQVTLYAVTCASLRRLRWVILPFFTLPPPAGSPAYWFCYTYHTPATPPGYRTTLACTRARHWLCPAGFPALLRRTAALVAAGSAAHNTHAILRYLVIYRRAPFARIHAYCAVCCSHTTAMPLRSSGLRSCAPRLPRCAFCTLRCGSIYASAAYANSRFFTYLTQFDSPYTGPLRSPHLDSTFTCCRTVSLHCTATDFRSHTWILFYGFSRYTVHAFIALDSPPADHTYWILLLPRFGFLPPHYLRFTTIPCLYGVYLVPSSLHHYALLPHYRLRLIACCLPHTTAFAIRGYAAFPTRMRIATWCGLQFSGCRFPHGFTWFWLLAGAHVCVRSPRTALPQRLLPTTALILRLVGIVLHRLPAVLPRHRTHGCDTLLLHCVPILLPLRFAGLPFHATLRACTGVLSFCSSPLCHAHGFHLRLRVFDRISLHTPLVYCLLPFTWLDCRDSAFFAVAYAVYAHTFYLFLVCCARLQFAYPRRILDGF